MKNILFLQIPGTPAFPDDFRENIPYAAGCLAAHLKNHGIDKKYQLLIPNHVKINQWGDQNLIQQILKTEPNWLAMTLYMWNVERSLFIASKVKKALPICNIVVGGPEVTGDNDWIFANKAIDHFVIGEGEKALFKIIRGGEKKRIIQATNKLNEYHSPYLSGCLPMAKGLPVYIEAQRGCPFHCSFCFYPKQQKEIRNIELIEVKKILRLAKLKKITDIIFVDPTFNKHRHFDKLLDILIEENKDRKLRYHAELKPHLLSTGQIKKLKRAGFGSLEVGLQTIKKETQKKIRCQIPLKRFSENVEKLDKKISVRIDLISGLPDETVRDITAGIKYVKRHHPNADIYLYHLSVIPGTALKKSTKPRDYQSLPPYFILNNGRIGVEELRSSNKFFYKLTGEELDPKINLEKIYRDRKKYDYRLFSHNTDFDNTSPASLFNVLEFKAEYITPDFQNKMYDKIKTMTSENPYSTFVIFINTRANISKDSVTEKIIRNSRLVYDQYINRSRLCSGTDIANLVIAFNKIRQNI